METVYSRELKNMYILILYSIIKKLDETNKFYVNPEDMINQMANPNNTIKQFFLKTILRINMKTASQPCRIPLNMYMPH